MAKRFIDTDIFKKQFIRGLDANSKLFFFYLITDCNHAGVWECDWEVASIRCGCELNKDFVIKNFGEKLVLFDGDTKIFIPSFIEFQYGELNPENRAHKSVIDILNKYKLNQNKGLKSTYKGSKDKDKDTDKVMDKVKFKEEKENLFKNELVQFKGIYSDEVLNGFYAYWSEWNKSGTKMRYENETTWELPKRLARWHSKR